MSDSRVHIPDSEESFARAAGRQILVYAVGAIVTIGLLMWGLQGLASMVGSGTIAGKAVDLENQSITIAIRTEPPQLNTTLATDSISGMVLGHVMEGLLRMSIDDRLEPAIAERWKITETQATFWLRDDAKWSDGKPITAHDFIFAWKTALLPELGSEYAFLLHAIKNGRAINKGSMPPASLGVSAPDDFTLIVDLERPIAFFDKMVTFQTYLPIREDFYNSTKGRFGADAEEMLYSGPFAISSWVHGSSLLMERNPYYWDQDSVSLKTINIGYITSDAGATLNFFKDEKIAYTTLLAENLGNALEQRWHIQREQDGTVFFLEFNHRDGRITRNHNLRRAMQLVMDMEELVYKVTKLPGYIPGKSLFPGWLQGVEDKFRKEYPVPKLLINRKLALQHLEMARRELGVDKIPEIVLLTGDNPVSNIQAEWTQAKLKAQLNIDVKIDKQIFKQRLAKMTSGDFDLVLAGWGPDYDDPLTFGDLFASWNLNNRGRYNNPQMDHFIEVAQQSVDPQTRMEAFAGIQKLAFDDVVLLPMYERGVTYVVHPQLKDVKRRVVGPEVDFTRSYIVAEGS
jgi:oligopeptide transport system substrate-binding protein